MPKLAKLREDLNARRDAARAIMTAAENDNGRDLTAEEQTAFDAALDDAENLESQIGRAMRLEGVETRSSAIVPAIGRGAGPVGAGQLRALGDPAKKDFETLSQFVSAVRFNPNDQRLSTLWNEEAGAGGGLGYDAETHAEMSMGVPASGGFAIPPQFVDKLLEIPHAGTAPIRAGAMVIGADPSAPDAEVTMPALDQSGQAPGHQFGGVTVAWIAEGAQKPLTDMKLTEVVITPYEVAGYMIVTDKLLRNWRGAEALIDRQFRGAMLEAGEYAFLQGAGAGKPSGIIPSGAAYHVERLVAGKVSYEDLVNMVSHFQLGGGGFWLMPQSVLPQIAMLTDPNGNYIYVANAKEGFAGTLLGYPVKWNPTSPQLGFDGDVCLIDPAYYIIKDGSGPFVAASEHVLFTQNKTVIKAFWNVGGAPALTAPIFDAGGYEISPFVVLDAFEL
jgi:HK97 family phage major capsid protein